MTVRSVMKRRRFSGSSATSVCDVVERGTWHDRVRADPKRRAKVRKPEVGDVLHVRCSACDPFEFARKTPICAVRSLCDRKFFVAVPAPRISTRVDTYSGSHEQVGIEIHHVGGVTHDEVRFSVSIHGPQLGHATSVSERVLSGSEVEIRVEVRSLARQVQETVRKGLALQYGDSGGLSQLINWP